MTHESDPNYIPPKDALETVGVAAEQITTNVQVFDLIALELREIDIHDTRIAVLVATLRYRGVTHETIAQKTGYSTKQVQRKEIEGVAILRTQEVTRTTSAIRSCDMSLTTMNEATTGKPTNEEAIAELEKAAITRTLHRSFLREDNSGFTEDDAEYILETIMERVEADAMPMVAGNYVRYIPLMAAEFNLKAKPVTPRTASQEGGASTPMGLEFHMKQALTDIKAIERAAGLAYVPTAQDYYAACQLMDYLNIEVLLEDDILQAVEALMA